jgi:hypothetical protein
VLWSFKEHFKILTVAYDSLNIEIFELTMRSDKIVGVFYGKLEILYWHERKQLNWKRHKFALKHSKIKTQKISINSF